MPGALDGLAATAKALILKFGKGAVLRRPNAVYDAATGTNVAGSPATRDFPVVISPPSPFATRYINGESILEGDTSAMVAAQGLAIVPTPDSDLVVLNGTVWQVVDVANVYSGELVAVYKLHLRQ